MVSALVLIMFFVVLAAAAARWGADGGTSLFIGDRRTAPTRRGPIHAPAAWSRETSAHWTA